MNERVLLVDKLLTDRKKNNQVSTSHYINDRINTFDWSRFDTVNTMLNNIKTSITVTFYNFKIIMIDVFQYCTMNEQHVFVWLDYITHILRWLRTQLLELYLSAEQTNTLINGPLALKNRQYKL